MYHRNIDERLQKRYDVVVVGARCAGAAIAMLLARAGMSVAVLDRGREGTDTLSTHALMRAGVIQLDRWGVLGAILDRNTPIVRSTTFHYGDTVVPIQLKPRDGIPGLVAPRRFVIDSVLVDAARASGAEVVFGVQVTGVKRDASGRLCGVLAKLVGDTSVVEVDARLVIGADGMHSTIARAVEATAYRTAQYTTAVLFNYFADVGFDGYHWYYRPNVSAGAIPTTDGMTCVFAAMPPARFSEVCTDVRAGHQQVIAECDDDLAARIARASKREKYRGFAGLRGYIRQPYGPGWALVGDAAYFKDPLTAHGMTDALVDAGHLARAILAGTDAALAEFQRERDDRTIKFFELTDQIASFTWDLASLQGLHRELSEEMKREAATTLALYA